MGPKSTDGARRDTTIGALLRHAEGVRAAELWRTRSRLSALTADERAAVEAATRAMIDSIVRESLATLEREILASRERLGAAASRMPR